MPVHAKVRWATNVPVSKQARIKNRFIVVRFFCANPHDLRKSYCKRCAKNTIKKHFICINAKKVVPLHALTNEMLNSKNIYEYEKIIFTALCRIICLCFVGGSSK